jgi:hypothetical protein
MNDYEPAELISVCDSIFEDGELSGEELYGLAEWLNNHRDACFCWPGNILVEPLQNVWADGKITKTELRTISRLLLRIRKEWAKRQAQDALERTIELVAHIAANQDASIPQLPSIPFTLRIKSQSTKSVFYDVDLSGPACTCPDWRSYRSELPIGHLTRCCKHVLEAYNQLEPKSGWPGWLASFIDNSWPPHPCQNWMVFFVGSSTVLASTAGKGWANVFSNDGGDYERYGYSVLEDRWSYGIEPYGARAIASAIVRSSL